jgi:hypothetical protein
MRIGRGGIHQIIVEEADPVGQMIGVYWVKPVMRGANISPQLAPPDAVSEN